MDESIDRRTFLAAFSKKIREACLGNMPLIEDIERLKQGNKPDIRVINEDPSRCLVCNDSDCKCDVHRV